MFGRKLLAHRWSVAIIVPIPGMKREKFQRAMFVTSRNVAIPNRKYPANFTPLPPTRTIIVRIFPTQTYSIFFFKKLKILSLTVNSCMQLKLEMKIDQAFHKQ